MKIIEKSRGNSEENKIKHLDNKFQKMLGRDANKNEIRFFPRLMHWLTEQYVDEDTLNGYEVDLLQDYQDKGLLVKQDIDIGCTKEFWDFVNEIVYDRYVCDIK